MQGRGRQSKTYLFSFLLASFEFFFFAAFGTFALKNLMLSSLALDSELRLFRLGLRESDLDFDLDLDLDHDLDLDFDLDLDLKTELFFTITS